ncbi:hypothetical protein E1A91_A11G157400v1 [Gossypium mustelinum]|uniref:Uncharacterized protein n=3 Tax=Gossypium TaxID=3633 RepID=A0A5J5TN38_GOSBA|nr:hypothetical protein ES319_A11G154500v1 [Gossypium barbadense]TYG94125.1 hypothetical protein ES288_A11G164400v1 [Gossypium darwinii]TYJ09684.1 hypothetical protein E1A91_A11G157400v1 [Gossypium mustelinum]
MNLYSDSVISYWSSSEASSLLEKARAEKKRAIEAPQPKRPRANGAGYDPRVTNITVDKTFDPRVIDRWP